MPRNTISIQLTPEMFDLLGDLFASHYPFPRNTTAQIAMRLGLRILSEHPELLSRYVGHWKAAKSAQAQAHKKPKAKGQKKLGALMACCSKVVS